MNNKSLTFLLSSFCVAFLFSCNGCSGNPVTGGSDMPNFINVSLNNNLLEITPSQQGFVQIFSSSFNPLDSTGFFTSKFAIARDSSFGISLPRGTFNIFVTDSSERKGVFIRDLLVGGLPEPISFSDTLAVFGSVEGVILGDFDSSKIFIPGSLSFSNVENSRFSLNNLPQGAYPVAIRVYKAINDTQNVADSLFDGMEFLVTPSQITQQDSILISTENIFSDNVADADMFALNLVQFASIDPQTHSHIVMNGATIIAASINTVYSFSSRLFPIASQTYDDFLYKLAQTSDNRLLLTFANSVQLVNPQTLEEISSFSAPRLLFLNAIQALDDSILIFAKRNDSIVMYKSSSTLENPHFASYIAPAPGPIFDVEVGIFSGGIVVSLNTPVDGGFQGRNEIFVISPSNGGYEISPFVFSGLANIPEIRKVTQNPDSSIIMSGMVRSQETDTIYPILIRLAEEGIFEYIFNNSPNYAALSAVELSSGGYGIVCFRPDNNEYKLIITDRLGNAVIQESFPSSLFAGRPSIDEIGHGRILVALPGMLSAYEISRPF